MKKIFFLDCIVLLFAILFLYTATNKMLEYSVFKEQIAETDLLAPVSSIIARLLPILEFLIVLLLFIPRWRKKGLLVSTCLMVAFTIYIVTLMLFADHLPCSCGGILSELSWPQHILFNSLFIVFGIMGIILERKISKERLAIITQKNSYGNAN